MSLSTPDPASPASVADASFGTARRGFDQGQVRDFLRMVAAELGRLQERERFLERELRISQSSPDIDAASLDDAALTRLLGEETARVLNTARESAREIREKAEESAARMLAEASDEVARIREQADLDSARMRADAASDAESEIEMAKQQGRDMVTEARAYRERVLTELARRRELAREQIEQLVHGRDRLIQAFERARLAAVDVVGELEPLGEPSEYVNLTPTTGPVPVMVPNSQPDPAPTEALPRTLDPGAGSDTDADAEGAVDAEPDHDLEGRSEEVADDAEGATAAPDETADDDIDDVADEASGADDDHDDVVEEAADADDAADEVVEEAADADDAASADDSADTVADELETDDDAADETQADVEDDAADPADADAEDESHAADDGDGRDDVVVDLFARLRAGATPEDVGDAADAADPGDEVDDDGAAAAGGGDADAEPDADAAVASATVVGDLDDAETGRADDDADDSDAESPFRRRDEELTPLIVASARKLKRVLADEQNGVLEVLRRDADVLSLDELVPSRDDQTSRYLDAVDSDLAEAAAAGARSVAGDDATLDDAAISAAQAAAGEIVADWLVGPLRERLERCVDEGDGDNAAISRRVRSVYREWKTQHIDEQLDDVLRSAYGRGALGAVDGSTSLLWLVDGEHPACPDCDDNSLSPPVAAGEPFPTGHTFAPAHPGCRCLVAVADR